MNVDDLRRELTERAEAVEAPPAMAEAVAGRVRAIRRRRAAVVAAVTAGVLVVAGAAAVGSRGALTTTPPPAGGTGLPGVLVGTDGMPTREVPAAPGDVVRDGLRFRAQVGDARLGAGRIGAVGQSTLSMPWTVTSSDVAVAADCWLPGADPQADDRPTAWLLVDGRRLMGAGCNAAAAEPGDLQTEGARPASGGWPELAPGHRAVFTVEVQDAAGRRVDAADIRLTAAVYVLGAQRDVVDPTTGRSVVQLDEVRELNGYRYRLAAVEQGPAGGAPVTMATPAGVPMLITSGSAGLDPEGGTAGDAGMLYLVGADEQVGRNASGGWSTQAQRARAAGQVTLRHEGTKPKRGVQFIALYTLEGPQTG